MNRAKFWIINRIFNMSCVNREFVRTISSNMLPNLILGGFLILGFILRAQGPGYFGTEDGLTYLPDGTGAQYSTSVNVTGFDGIVISNEQDLSQVCITMEHSYMGDLEIWLQCPSGVSVPLLNSYNPGFLPGGTSGGGIFLGHPVDDSGGGGAGLGFEYCFSSVFNTITGSMTQNLTNTIPVSSVVTTTPPLSAGVSMNPYVTYEPEGSFSELIGCPVNGQWTIYVQDNLGIDDGWIFGWGMYFDPILIGCSGRVYNDINGNCQPNNMEFGVQGIEVLIEPGSIVAQTNALGAWYIDSLPDGNYTATIDTTNLNWIATCSVTQSFMIDNTSTNLGCPNFAVINIAPCSDPDVTIYAPILRPCLPNQNIFVSACNQFSATGSLNASYVDVELDPLMTVTASSLPYTSQGANVYRFQTGTLYPGQCVNFSISTTISSPTLGCAELLGLTLCMDANLYPVQPCTLDTIPSDPPSGGGGSGGGTLSGLPQPCILPWDQSSLSVDGWCENDTIYFTITNTGALGGGDMECFSPVWVTVDGVVTFTDSIMIQGGEAVTYSFPGDGATWILNAAQHPLHPGNSNPNAYVEACGDLNNWTPDLVNDFPQDDADPVVDIYCGIITGSYDPNDKTGYPNGETDQFYIQPNQQLQYVIRFQNTGTDTAFTVVIRDTLDIDLNIFTVTSGVSSHAYEFRMYGPRVLEWTFNNINLPDSSANQEESNGFVTFHVEQIPDLAPGTEILNDADIYFDFNDPITTNTTVHRIFNGFVSVGLDELSQQEWGMSVYPNPSDGQFTIVLEKLIDDKYLIVDQLGRIVQSGSIKEKTTNVNLALESGMYYLLIGEGVAKFQVIK
jgi:uncharacterized repeat protein (TIGR01451 family)